MEGDDEQVDGRRPATVDGEMMLGANALRRLSCSFVAPNEAPSVAVAGPSGLDVLVMQFPTRSCDARPGERTGAHPVAVRSAA